MPLIVCNASRHNQFVQKLNKLVVVNFSAPLLQQLNVENKIIKKCEPFGNKNMNNRVDKLSSTKLPVLSFNFIPICDQSVIISNIKNSISLQLPAAYDLPISTKSVIIAGGGPSLCEYVNNIKDLQKKGAKILALNEAGYFLIKNHIYPWGIVNISPSEDTTHCIGDPLPEIKYFLASILI